MSDPFLDALADGGIWIYGAAVVTGIGLMVLALVLLLARR